MPRLTKDQWAEARVQWEADPTLTFESLGKTLAVSREAVGQRARKDGWQRDPSLHDVARRAQFKADQREASSKVPAEVPGGRLKTDSRALAEDIRADVIERHRADWAEHRQLFATSDIAANFEIGKSAKISAEMLSIRQRGERDAYGLSEAATQQTPPEPDWAVLIGQRVTVEVQR